MAKLSKEELESRIGKHQKMLGTLEARLKDAPIAQEGETSAGNKKTVSPQSLIKKSIRKTLKKLAHEKVLLKKIAS